MFIRLLSTRFRRLALAIVSAAVASAACVSPALAGGGSGSWDGSGAPVNTALPTLTVSSNGSLTTTYGSWTNSPTSYRIQWYDCDSSGNNCTAIAGANGQSYAVQASDFGHTIRSDVGASNSYGTTYAFSAPTSVILTAARNWG
jgi:hypothetical protein